MVDFTQPACARSTRHPRHLPAFVGFSPSGTNARASESEIWIGCSLVAPKTSPRAPWLRRCPRIAPIRGVQGCCQSHLERLATTCFSNMEIFHPLKKHDPVPTESHSTHANAQNMLISSLNKYTGQTGQSRPNKLRITFLGSSFFLPSSLGSFPF